MTKALGLGLTLFLAACGDSGGNGDGGSDAPMRSPDLTMPAPDLSAAADLAMPPGDDAGADLAMVTDASAPSDLTTLPDLTPLPPPDGGPLATLSGTLRDTNGNPVAGGTVSILGSATSTTTDAGGNFSLGAPTQVPIYLRFTAPNFEVAQLGMVVTGSFTGLNLPAVPKGLLAAILGALNPPLTVDTTKGTVLLPFGLSQVDGGVSFDASVTTFGATLSAAHDPSVAVVNSVPSYASGAPANSVLLFPNVVAGTTTLTLAPPMGVACLFPTDPPNAAQIVNWRVDPNVLLFEPVNCQ
jgi:hypothetical protein